MLALGCSRWIWDWLDCAFEALGQAVQDVIGGIFGFLFDTLKKIIIDAVVAVLKAVGRLWIDIKTPGIEDNTAVTFVQAHTFYILVFAATLSVIIGGIRMALTQRGEPLRDIIKSLLTMVVVSGAGVTVANTLIKVSDAFSGWIIDRAVGGSNFDAKLDREDDEPAQGQRRRPDAGDRDRHPDGDLGPDPARPDDHPVRNAGAAGRRSAADRGGHQHRGRDDVVQTGLQLAGRIHHLQTGGRPHLRHGDHC